MTDILRATLRAMEVEAEKSLADAARSSADLARLSQAIDESIAEMDKDVADFKDALDELIKDRDYFDKLLTTAEADNDALRHALGTLLAEWTTAATGAATDPIAAAVYLHCANDLDIHLQRFTRRSREAS